MHDDDTPVKVALILLIVAMVAFGGLGIYYMNQVGSPQKPETLEAELAKQAQFVIDERKAIEDLNDTIEGNRRRGRPFPQEGEQKLTGLKADLAQLDWDIAIIVADHKRQQLTRRGIVTGVAVHNQRAAEVESAEGKIDNALRNDDEYGLEWLRGKQDEFEQEYQKDRSALQTAIDDASAQLRSEKARYEEAFEQKRRYRSRIETGLAQAKEDLQKATKKEPAEINIDSDGVVLISDVESRQVVIDIGEQQGVKRGMYFEVFQLRHGSRRHRKGFIVVRSVKAEEANCIILNKEIRLPRCQGCGYTARLPEEMYCPYWTGSQGGFHVQRLKASPKEAILGMTPDDPIVAGDEIYNPFFNAKRQLHIAVKGDPLYAEYATDYIMAEVRRHGAIVDPEVGAKTDILLSGRWAGEDRKRAQEFGVHVLGQYEVFDFLRK